MNILVTGGLGFIGSHTIIELLNHGHDVVAIDNLSNCDRSVVEVIETLTQKSINFSTVDVRDNLGLNQVFDHHKIDAVIHFAGVKSVAESVKHPLTYYDNNMVGTYNLLSCMATHSVFRLIFSSSATVYGESDIMPLTEEARTNPINPYGKTKLFVEEMCSDLFESDPRWGIVLLRYFNPVGAHKSGLIGENPKGIPNNLFPVVAQVASGSLDQLLIFGDDYETIDGTGVRDYIHVEDLAMGHVKAIDYVMNNNGAEVFNLGTGNGYSVKQVIDTFERVNGIEIARKVVNRRPGDMAECYADPNKAKRMLQWEAKLSLEDMCRDSWRFQKRKEVQYD